MKKKTMKNTKKSSIANIHNHCKTIKNDENLYF